MDSEGGLTEEERECIVKLRGLDEELCAPFDDEFLGWFVLSRKRDVQRALEVLRNHVEWRKEYEMDNLDLVKIKRVLLSGMYIFLPPNMRGPEDAGVCYIMAQHCPDEIVTDMRLMMQVTWFTMSRLYKLNINNARKGMMFVEDFTGMTFSKLVHLASDGARNKKTMDALQDHLPGRFRSFLLTNTPWWIRIPIKLMQPFMKPKLRSKFIVASNEEVIAKLGGSHMVPQSLDGTFEVHLRAIVDMFPELENVSLQPTPTAAGGEENFEKSPTPKG